MFGENTGESSDESVIIVTDEKISSKPNNNLRE